MLILMTVCNIVILKTILATEQNNITETERTMIQRRNIDTEKQNRKKS
jgi:hypothetical protein